jgi:PleD family two-component response regulator
LSPTFFLVYSSCRYREIDTAIGPGSILIVDDEDSPSARAGLDYEVETATDREHALDKVREHRFDLVIMDLFIGDIRDDTLGMRARRRIRVSIQPALQLQQRRRGESGADTGRHEGEA